MQVEFATVTWPIFQLIIVIIVVFFLGAFLGFYSSGSETKKKLKEAEAKAEMVERARKESERALSALRAAPPPPAAPPGKSLLRLWLDEGERPRLDLDGHPVDTAPIAEANRKRLIMLINILRPWIEGKPLAASAPIASPPPAPVAATPSPAVPAPQPIPASAPAPATPLTAKNEEKPAAPLSMVGQIDEILQARIAVGPLAGRGIQLIESPEGGVLVRVGTQKFNGVGEVTDPQIQAEIRAAIAEWEKKYTPGL